MTTKENCSTNKTSEDKIHDVEGHPFDYRKYGFEVVYPKLENIPLPVLEDRPSGTICEIHDLHECAAKLLQLSKESSQLNQTTPEIKDDKKYLRKNPLIFAKEIYIRLNENKLCHKTTAPKASTFSRLVKDRDPELGESDIHAFKNKCNSSLVLPFFLVFLTVSVILIYMD